MADLSGEGPCPRGGQEAVGPDLLTFRGVTFTVAEKQRVAQLTRLSMHDLNERGSQRDNSLDNTKVALYHATAFVRLGEQYLQCEQNVHKIARDNHVGYISKQVVEAFRHERASHSGENIALVRAIVQRMIAASIDEKVLPRSLSENVEAIRDLLTTVCRSVMTAVMIQGGSEKTFREQKSHEVCMPCSDKNMNVALRVRVHQEGHVVCTSDSPTMDKISQKARPKLGQRTFCWP